jgi:hypothetical protein
LGPATRRSQWSEDEPVNGLNLLWTVLALVVIVLLILYLVDAVG